MDDKRLLIDAAFELLKDIVLKSDFIPNKRQRAMLKISNFVLAESKFLIKNGNIILFDNSNSYLFDYLDDFIENLFIYNKIPIRLDMVKDLELSEKLKTFGISKDTYNMYKMINRDGINEELRKIELCIFHNIRNKLAHGEYELSGNKVHLSLDILDKRELVIPIRMINIVDPFTNLNSEIKTIKELSDIFDKDIMSLRDEMCYQLEYLYTNYGSEYLKDIDLKELSKIVKTSGSINKILKEIKSIIKNDRIIDNHKYFLLKIKLFSLLTSDFITIFNKYRKTISMLYTDSLDKLDINALENIYLNKKDVLKDIYKVNYIDFDLYKNKHFLKNNSDNYKISHNNIIEDNYYYYDYKKIPKSKDDYLKLTKYSYDRAMDETKKTLKSISSIIGTSNYGVAALYNYMSILMANRKDNYSLTDYSLLKIGDLGLNRFWYNFDASLDIKTIASDIKAKTQEFLDNYNSIGYEDTDYDFDYDKGKRITIKGTKSSTAKEFDLIVDYFNSLVGNAGLIGKRNQSIVNHVRNSVEHGNFYCGVDGGTYICDKDLDSDDSFDVTLSPKRYLLFTEDYHSFEFSSKDEREKSFTIVDFYNELALILGQGELKKVFDKINPFLKDWFGNRYSKGNIPLKECLDELLDCYDKLKIDDIKNKKDERENYIKSR